MAVLRKLTATSLLLKVYSNCIFFDKVTKTKLLNYTKVFFFFKLFKNSKHILEYQEFKQKLVVFNNRVETHGRYLCCVGPVNIRMWRCSFGSCDKSRMKDDRVSTELFFIDKLEKSQTRSAFCYRCLIEYFTKINL